MSAGSPSLLTFLDAPIVVGDPQSYVTYVNPAFERRFEVVAETSLGQSLAALFDGGMRESVLSAVAQSCASGQTTRFRVRYNGAGFHAVTSPIVANGSSIGVVILLAESAAADERCLALQRDFEEPLGEVDRVLDELLEQTCGKRAQRFRTLVEDAIRAVERAKKSNAELRAVLAGAADEALSARGGKLDPARVIQDAAARVRELYSSARVDLEILLPGQLPAASGESARLEKALFLLLESRAKNALESETVTIAARTVGRGDAASVVISVVDSPRDGDSDRSASADSQAVALVRELGGDMRTTSDAFAGRTTSIRLSVA